MPGLQKLTDDIFSKVQQKKVTRLNGLQISASIDLQHVMNSLFKNKSESLSKKI